MSEEAEETVADENEESGYSPVGERLSAARKQQGLDLTTIAERTRVPIRHLEAIERSDFAALPGATYTLGFARSYARSLGLDAAEIGSQLRSELNDSGHDGYQAPSQSYEPADPARVPPKAFAWTAAGIAALLLIGYLIWRSSIFDGGSAVDDIVATEAEDGEASAADASAAAGGGATPDANAPVVLTANSEVWVRVYDAENNRLYENVMQAGDSFTVPADADRPMINTGRAQAIDVTIGGQKVAPLAEPDIPVKDIEISASALLSRGETSTDSE